MLTPLSIFSLDQGPKWRDLDDTERARKADNSRSSPAWSLALLGAVGAWLVLSAPAARAFAVSRLNFGGEEPATREAGRLLSKRQEECPGAGSP